MDTWKQKLILRLPALGVLLVSLLFWTSYDRYTPSGEAFLSGATLAQAERVRGEVREEMGAITLTASSTGGVAIVDFRFEDLTDAPFVRVSASIELQEVVVGQRAWNCARLALGQFSEKGKWLPCHHVVAAGFGSGKWKPYQDVFEIRPDAAYIDVSLQQLGSDGVARYKQIEVIPVKIRASFIWWRIFFALLWVGMAIFYFPICRLHYRRLRWLILLNSIAILIGVLMPAKWISDVSQQGRRVVRELQEKRLEKVQSSAPVSCESITEKTEELTEKSDPKRTRLTAATKGSAKYDLQLELMVRFDKLMRDTHRAGHFLLFSMLCFLVYLSAALEHQHKIYFCKVGADILLFAGITEMLQFLTLDRTPGVQDLWVDFCGMGLAFISFLTAYLLRHGFRRWKRHSHNA